MIWITQKELNLWRELAEGVNDKIMSDMQKSMPFSSEELKAADNFLAPDEPKTYNMNIKEKECLDKFMADREDKWFRERGIQIIRKTE
jgi:hypothetical protein